MNGIVEARSACSRVFGSRMDAQFMSRLVICSMVILLGLRAVRPHVDDLAVAVPGHPYRLPSPRTARPPVILGESWDSDKLRARDGDVLIPGAVGQRRVQDVAVAHQV